MLEAILAIATILGGIAAVWFFWDRLAPKTKPDRQSDRCSCEHVVILPAAGLPNAVLRTDIEKALDELTSYEEGMKFQALAVILAKQKWPDLVACERKWDQGLDAYAPASFARDRVGRGLACSITAKLSKVKTDVSKIREHYVDVRVLVFATPASVTAHTASKWSGEIRRSYGLDLVVMPREDIVMELMLPKNAAICSTLLGIPATVEADVAALLGRTQEAADEVISSRLEHPRLTGRPKLQLKINALDEGGRDTGRLLDLDGLQAALLEARRIVLEAPAGRGKTVTLLQLAESLCRERVPFVIDLPLWMVFGDDILDFIANSPPFKARGIQPQELARLCKDGYCAFLFNGWNEISDSHSEKAQALLSDVERSFPTAGIIVATRTHRIHPPLPGSIRVGLLQVSRSQRAEYIREALAEQAAEFVDFLDREPVLDDLTRTPLILSEVTSTFESGERIPKTKMGVLADVLRHIERTEEHQGPLARAPLSGLGRNYLTRLAAHIIADGAVTIREGDARAIVSDVSLVLRTEGQLAIASEPAAVLGTLTAHHVLELLEYPAVAFRFEHQQFQEFLAATELDRRLYELIREDDSEASRHFAREFVNRPHWEEPLRMLAGEIGARSETEPDVADHVRVGVGLIEMALNIDPIFAADLSHLCGPLVWREVCGSVSTRLRVWHQIDDPRHRQCALAAMLATGSEDFIDIVLPLLTSDDQQIRLETYRTWSDFQLSTLGSDWRRVVKVWKEKHRSDFVTELVFGNRMADIAEEFARTDPSPEVRTEALRALGWVHADLGISRVLTELDDSAFEQILQNHVLDGVPAELIPRALKTYQRLIAAADDPPTRLSVRLAAAELGANNVPEGVKEDLRNWPSGKVDDTYELFLKSALEAVQRTDPQWVSCWVAERVRDGCLWPERWTGFIRSIPTAMRVELLDRLSSEDLDYRDTQGIVSILATTADTHLVGDIFTRLCGIRTQISQAAGETEQRRLWGISRQLERLFHEIEPEVAVSGVLSHLSPEFNTVEYELTTELFGRIDSVDSGLKSQLHDDVRQNLRQYLKNGLSFTLSQEDFDGQLKRNLAMALAQVSDSQENPDLHRLIRADIDRLRRGREARERGERGPLANGAHMSCSNWHVKALVQLDPLSAEKTLLALLQEPEYETEVAGALVELSRTGEEEKHPHLDPDYSTIWEAQTGRVAIEFDETHRRRYAQAFKQRIIAIKEDRIQGENPGYFNHRLMEFAGFLAIIDGSESADLIMDILELSSQWDGGIRVDTLNSLLFSGVHLSAEQVIRILDPTINDSLKQIHDQQSGFLLRQCLCLGVLAQPLKKVYSSI